VCCVFVFLLVVGCFCGCVSTGCGWLGGVGGVECFVLVVCFVWVFCGVCLCVLVGCWFCGLPGWLGFGLVFVARWVTLVTLVTLVAGVSGRWVCLGGVSPWVPPLLEASLPCSRFCLCATTPAHSCVLVQGVEAPLTGEPLAG